MAMIVVAIILCAFVGVLNYEEAKVVEESDTFSNNETLFEANRIMFNFEGNEGAEEEYENGGYEGVLLAGAKFLDDTLFVSFPRWASIAPATFGTLNLNTGKVSPFPNWEGNNPYRPNSDPSKVLYSVLGFEFDENDNIFVLDQGKICDEEAVEGSIKVIRYSKNGDILNSWPIPQEIASTFNSFVNDLVYDPVKQYLYISDCGKPISEEGKEPVEQTYMGQIISFDIKNEEYKYYLRGTKYTNPEKDYVFHIREDEYRTYTGVDGIALSPDGRYLYFCPLTSRKLYRIETSYLRGSSSESEIEEAVEYIMDRPSAADGIMFDGSGNLYLTGIETYSVYVYENSLDRLDFENISSRYFTLVKSTTNLGWCDTMGFTKDGSITVVSNNLDLFDQGLMFTDDRMDAINFRITKILTGATPYWENILSTGTNEADSNTNNGVSVGGAIGIGIGCFVAGLIPFIVIIVMKYIRKSDTARNPLVNGNKSRQSDSSSDE